MFTKNSPFTRASAMAKILICFFVITLFFTGAEAHSAKHQQEFSFETVKSMAKALALTTYTAPDETLPQAFRDLDQEEWSAIDHKETEQLWLKDQLSFRVQLLPPGHILQHPLKLSVIEKGKSTKVAVHKDMFRIEDEDVLEDLPQEFHIGGIQILFPLHSPYAYDPIATFVGATFFRAFGKQAQAGVFARGITLNTALHEGEEFPHFSHIWLEKPAVHEKTLRIYALMDAPSMTGAFSLTLSPATTTVMDVHCVLFPRGEENTLRKVGIAPLTSMFYFAQNNGNPQGKDKASAHSSNGFLYLDAHKKWHWRPLTNPQRLNITTIENTNPLGFGLLQRDLEPAHYSPTGQHLAKQTSLWVTPKGTWGRGHLELIEIPTRSDKHNNIALFWVPENVHAHEAQHATPQSPLQVETSYAYTLYWTPAGATPHILGKVVSTREIRDDGKASCTFWVDFDSPSMQELPAHMGLASVLELPDNVELLHKKLEKNTDTGGWRLIFSVKLPEPENIVQTLIPSRTLSAMDFKAYLTRGENLPQAITEIWHYSMAQ